MSRQSWCFCTLALGEPYWNLTKQLAGDLSRFAPGVKLFVLTENTEIFKDIPNVQAIRHRQRSVLGYNDKLCVIRKALEQHQTAVFVDADIRVLGPIDIRPEMFQPGLRGFLIYTWAWLHNYHDADPNPPAWKRDNVRLMTLLSKQFDLPGNGRDVPFVCEGLFSVTASGATDVEAFLRKWNQLAEFCERKKFFIHEGYSVGLAARLTNFPISQDDFSWLKFFEPWFSEIVHIPNGAMTKEEYTALKVTVDRYKYSRSQARLGRARVMNALKKRLRYFRVKLFGLNLLDA
jgi:hypothetical protein